MKASAKVVLALTTAGIVLFTTAMAAVGMTTSTSHFSLPISEVITCSERVRVTGEFDFVSHTTVTDGGATLVVLQFRGDDIVGTGLRTGASYSLVGAAAEVTFQGVPVFTTTFVHHGTLVGGDPGAEHPLSLAFHATVNKKNDVSIELDRSECF